MTLLFVDGFDHYTTADITKKYVSSVYATISASGGRRSSGAYVGALFHGTTKALSGSSASIVIGMAIKPTTLNGLSLFQILEGSTPHLTVVLETSGFLSIKRGSYTGTNLATGATALSAGTWYYIELKATINDSTGATELRINGASEAALTLTGADTRNGGTSGVVDTIALGEYGGGGNGNSATYDDLYVCNTSGGTNDNFLGDCRVDTIYPSGAGNYTQFTPSTGSNYACVDETAPNTSDYVSDATSGHRDSYAFGDLTALTSQTVYGIQVSAYAQKSDAGSRSLGTMARLSSTDKDGGGVALGTSYTYISEVFETDPASSAWTESNVNAAEFGVKVTA